MDALLGLAGLLGIIISVLWSVACLFKRRPLKVPAVLMAGAVILFSAGLAISPDRDQEAEEVPEETALEEPEPAPDDPEEPEIEEEPPAEEAPEEPEEEPAEPEEEKLDPDLTVEAHFIDVGQGDAVFLDAPVKDILIDGGDRGDTVVNYLDRLGVESLDLVIGTHPHADHIGGLINLFEEIPVDEVLDPGVTHTTITFEDYIDLIDQKDIDFTEGSAGMERDLGEDSTMKVIFPRSPSEDHLNNASIVTKVTFGEVSFMFTGDAEKEAEQEILTRDYNLDSDILKVGHHGSRTSTTQGFLEEVDPETAVIMCGLDNQYGHPHEETLTRLYQAGVDIYRTDHQGSIVITTDGETYEIDQEPWN